MAPDILLVITIACVIFLYADQKWQSLSSTDNLNRFGFARSSETNESYIRSKESIKLKSVVESLPNLKESIILKSAAESLPSPRRVISKFFLCFLMFYFMSFRR